MGEPSPRLLLESVSVGEEAATAVFSGVLISAVLLRWTESRLSILSCGGNIKPTSFTPLCPPALFLRPDGPEQLAPQRAPPAGGRLLLGCTRCFFTR